MASPGCMTTGGVGGVEIKRGGGEGYREEREREERGEMRKRERRSEVVEE